MKFFRNCLACGLVAVTALVLCGCMANKGSHQNGIVFYVSTSGQIGVGYGETEDVPAGCYYRNEKRVYTVTDASFFGGATTNSTETVVEWDTRAMVTNGVPVVTAASDLR